MAVVMVMAFVAMFWEVVMVVVVARSWWHSHAVRDKKKGEVHVQAGVNVSVR
jgi:hypothetical protein